MRRALWIPFHPYKSWAKQLLGASERQNAATALSELGLDSSGYFYCGLRCGPAQPIKLWLYASVFRCSHAWPTPWGHHSQSQAPQLDVSRRDLGDLKKYQLYVRSRCGELSLPAWAAEAEKSIQVPPYLSFQPCHCTLLQLVASLLCCGDRQSIRSLCRLRGGVSRVTHRDGKLSQAQLQQCILFQ